MQIKEYNHLPEEALKIREEVFVKEQGFIDEFDEVDKRSKHLIVYEEDKPVATCRIYYNREKQSHTVGRLAVVKEWRGNNIGSRILQEAEKIVRREGGKRLALLSQEHVADFYLKQGYKREGEIFTVERCPHIWVKKAL